MKPFVFNFIRAFPQTVIPEKRGDIWQWGFDNMEPQRLASLARKSVAHRRVLNDKADYISGKGFAYDENNKTLDRIIRRANAWESLRSVLNKLAFDKCTFGNAFLEIAVNRGVVVFFHQDATLCRVNENGYVVLDKDWGQRTETEEKLLPLYPNFEKQPDGSFRCVYHYKDYEPMYTHYGVPQYIAGLVSSEISYKTDDWNKNRINNSFQLSGVLEVPSTFDSEERAEDFKREIEKQFSGKPGQVLFSVKDEQGTGRASFTPISSDNDGDWLNLHNVSINDIVVAHSWFKTLSGLDYTSGFSADRILNEYEIALNTIIVPEQTELMEPIRQVLGRMGVDTDSVSIVNKAPLTQRPQYMRIWEARKADGLDYDENDPEQQKYLSNLGKNADNT